MKLFESKVYKIAVFATNLAVLACSTKICAFWQDED